MGVSACTVHVPLEVICLLLGLWQAIYRDANFRGGFYSSSSAPSNGLSIARQIAMISYRSHTAYVGKFGRGLQQPAPGTQLERVSGAASEGKSPSYAVQCYLEYKVRKRSLP